MEQLIFNSRNFRRFGALVLTTALLAGCTAQAAKEDPKSGAAQEQQIKTVKVTNVTKQKIGEPIETVADIISSIQLDVVAKTGGDVLEVLKKRGDLVQKGDVIIKLDPTDASLQKEKAQLGLRSAQEQLRKAKEDFNNNRTKMVNGITKLETTVKDQEKNFNKMHNDYDAGLITKIQLDQAETALNNLKLDLEIARKELKTLDSTNPLVQLEVQVESSALSIREVDRNLGYLEIKAPVSGILTDLPVEVGMTVSPGFKTGTVQQVNPIKIRAELTDATAALVRGKSEVTFYVPGTTDKRKAKVEYLSDVVNPQTKSYQVDLTVGNEDQKLKPGMKAQLVLTEENESSVVAVPSSSIVREANDTFVFILNNDTVEKRKVQLGRVNDTYQEVLNGVKENEPIVISGQHQLKDKEKVQLAK